MEPSCRGVVRGRRENGLGWYFGPALLHGSSRHDCHYPLPGQFRIGSDRDAPRASIRFITLMANPGSVSCVAAFRLLYRSPMSCLYR